jgi:SWI/SNF-related matrix-associated actin-dependent regulator of chromatin subfamily D
MAHNPYRHQRNKTSLGSITFADLSNTINRPAPGLPPMVPNAQHPSHGPPQRSAQQAQIEAKRDAYQRHIATVPTDRDIPDGVEDLAIGDVVQRYDALRKVEKKLDSLIMQKRLETKDPNERVNRRLRTMRVWISSVCPEDTKYSDSTTEESDFKFKAETKAGLYRMRIEGRLLPEPGDEEDSEDEDFQPGDGATMDVDKPESEQTEKPTSKSKSPFERAKFSHYFKNIQVAFSPHPRAPPGSSQTPIEWKKPDLLPNGHYPTTPGANFDALEFERKADEPLQQVTITLHRDEPLGRLRGRLSEPLARILDQQFEDQSSATIGLHNYVRLKHLEQDGHPQNVRCDEPLREVSFELPQQLLVVC